MFCSSSVRLLLHYVTFKEVRFSDCEHSSCVYFRHVRKGRYHIEACTIILKERQKARRSYSPSFSVAGITVPTDIFEVARRPKVQFAKINGFVLSASVARDNPMYAPTNDEIERGIQVGRKGYVRCMRCNAEVFAPNARHHSLTCLYFHGF